MAPRLSWFFDGTQVASALPWCMRGRWQQAAAASTKAVAKACRISQEYLCIIIGLH
jgi:hypothetical protein